MDKSEVCIKKEHLKLLERAYWRWEDYEYGGPAIDCKRPFGNSDVEGDIIEILGWDSNKCPHCHESLDERLNEKAAELYRELEVVIPLIINGFIQEHGDEY